MDNMTNIENDIENEMEGPFSYFIFLLMIEIVRFLP